MQQAWKVIGKLFQNRLIGCIHWTSVSNKAADRNVCLYAAWLVSLHFIWKLQVHFVTPYNDISIWKIIKLHTKLRLLSR